MFNPVEFKSNWELIELYKRLVAVFGHRCVRLSSLCEYGDKWAEGWTYIARFQGIYLYITSRRYKKEQKDSSLESVLERMACHESVKVA